jgi:antitoxin (DNA-binding transcriptional repressor) of toxin-antitoxin stability system
LTGVYSVARIEDKMCTELEQTMETIAVKQFRDNLSEILKRVEKGQLMRVLRHGKEVVELRPIDNKREQEISNRLKDKELLGGGTGVIGSVKSVKNRKPEMPISDLVTKDRR